MSFVVVFLIVFSCVVYYVANVYIFFFTGKAFVEVFFEIAEDNKYQRIMFVYLSNIV